MKIKKYSRIYALATQGIFSMLVYAGIGYLIGYLINKSVLLSVILAIVGVILGLITFIWYLLYLSKQDETEKKDEMENENSE